MTDPASFSSPCSTCARYLPETEIYGWCGLRWGATTWPEGTCNHYLRVTLLAIAQETRPCTRGSATATTTTHWCEATVGTYCNCVTNADGAWFVFGRDMQDYPIGLFATEVEALRCALTNHGEAVFWPYGDEWRATEARSRLAK